MSIVRRSFLRAVPAAAAALAVPGLLSPARASVVAGGQSPVDIELGEVRVRPDLPALRVSYGRSDLRVAYISRGLCGERGEEETVEAFPSPGAGTVAVGGTEYRLERFHFHTPSEHTVDGWRAPLEQHFVHRSDSGAVLVIGLLLVPSGRRAPVDAILDRLPEECGEELSVPGVDLRSLLPRRLDAFRYDGSLTTSPFTEGVAWNVLLCPGEVSSGGLHRFRSLFPDGNSRETQPLGDREIALVPAGW
jgi:carbonic anhydrase